VAAVGVLLVARRPDSPLTGRVVRRTAGHCGKELSASLRAVLWALRQVAACGDRGGGREKAPRPPRRAPPPPPGGS